MASCSPHCYSSRSSSPALSTSRAWAPRSTPPTATRTYQSVTLPALRGSVYDRNGNLLAVSVPRVDVVSDNYLASSPGADLGTLAHLLRVPASASLPACREERLRDALRQVGPATEAAVQALDLPNVSFVPRADVADYGEWKTGRRATGTVISAAVLCAVDRSGSGRAISGWLLALLAIGPTWRQWPTPCWAFALSPRLIRAGFSAVAVCLLFDGVSVWSIIFRYLARSSFKLKKR